MTEEEEANFIEAMKSFGAKCIQKRETKDGKVIDTLYLIEEE